MKHREGCCGHRRQTSRKRKAPCGCHTHAGRVPCTAVGCCPHKRAKPASETRGRHRAHGPGQGNSNNTQFPPANGNLRHAPRWRGVPISDACPLKGGCILPEKMKYRFFIFMNYLRRHLWAVRRGCACTCLGATARQTGLTGHFAASKSVWRAVWFFLWKERGHKTPRHCGESRHPVGRLRGTERCSGLRLSLE